MNWVNKSQPCATSASLAPSLLLADARAVQPKCNQHLLYAAAARTFIVWLLFICGYMVVSFNVIATTTLTAATAYSNSRTTCAKYY